MINKYLLTALPVLLLAAPAAHAQADFGPGYVVPLAGDTVRGQLDYRTARQSSLSCRFRANAQAMPTTYGPAELRGYGLLSIDLTKP